VNGSGTDANGERLATVSYFPGVVPPVTEPFAPPPSAPAVGPEQPVLEKPVLEKPVLEKPELQKPALQKLAEAAAQIIAEHPAEAEGESRGERSARASNVSMHALARRGMSSSEMTKLLESRELDADDVQSEVDRLESVGLLDDADLASTLVRSLQQRKGLGRSAISAELRRRRIDATAIEQALEELDGDDELTRAREIAIKRAGQLRSLDPETARRRLGAFLMRRGYSGSIVSSAVASALSPGAGGRGTGGPRFE
jgi:regulatory protein